MIRDNMTSSNAEAKAIADVTAANEYEDDFLQ
jgi:hypothetical protein